jgi:hypothetical protein
MSKPMKTNKQPNPKLFYSLYQAKQVLSCNQVIALHLIKMHKVKTTMIDGRPFFRKSAINRILSKKAK